ncbi:hypothetical protein C5167_017826 [Papaver somniferum]|uniref:Uncharacterized protein n=1 Tax=Papaver somniferum TaxID=3469 RepID=A0A4Y7IPI3_PAPSO|nr:hypothetical protein C5167_017826 [Papaver somniferum]
MQTQVFTRIAPLSDGGKISPKISCGGKRKKSAGTFALFFMWAAQIFWDLKTKEELQAKEAELNKIERMTIFQLVVEYLMCN